MPQSNASSGAIQVFWVVVLGDFGRSPRMQFHAQSLAQRDNVEVHVIAYGGAKPLSSLTSASNVHLSILPQVPLVISKVPLGVLRLALKALHQLIILLWIMLFKLPRPRAILMQNPPAIPSLLVCRLAALRHQCRLVIDWHNFAFSIMALKHNKEGAIVRAAKSHEASMGRAAHSHLCVTSAMKSELTDSNGAWRLPPSRVTVLYDRPPARFKRTTLTDAHELLVRISDTLAIPPGSAGVDFASEESREWGSGRTIATWIPDLNALNPPVKRTRSSTKIANHPEWRPGRPAILVSSTSWTPDEDFGILLDALVEYEMEKTKVERSRPSPLPDLLVIITGKGPEREAYLDKVAGLRMRHVAVRSVWLEPEDYPLILGLADIGVSLHSSSSGLDLPMKIVDMFGSGLPVLALNYNCIRELVEEGETGLLFSSSDELAGQLKDLLGGGSNKWSLGKLGAMRAHVEKKEMALRWEENWERVAWPVLRG